MKRDLTELDKLDNWLREHAEEYNLQYTRYDNDNAYAGVEEVERLFHYLPVDKHIIHVYKHGTDNYFTAVCQAASLGGNNGLIEVHGDIVNKQYADGFIEGYLTADEIILRVENEFAKTDSAV